MQAKAFFKNYTSTLLLLLGLLAGGTVGALLGSKASVLQPVGTIFLNLVFVLVVPLVFLSVAQSMVVLRRNGMIGKVLGISFGVFLVMSLLVGILTYGVILFWNPFTDVASSGTAGVIGGFMGESVNIGDAISGAFTVSDFPMLLSKENLLPLIVFSSLFGISVAFLGPAVPTIEKLIFEGSAVIMKMMDLLMKLAPIGIGCYFAYTVGQLGGQIVGNYLQIFLLVTFICLFVYVVFNSLYAVFCGIPLGKFWREMIVPSVTAVGTCSSAACMPVNIEAARKLGVSDKIANGVVPLGTNLHKDGCIITGIVKILFTLYFFGFNPTGLGTAALIILISLLCSLVVGAIPIGGMTGELLICVILGVDPSFAATLMIIGTIVDIPATLVNSTGNLVAPLLVDRLSK